MFKDYRIKIGKKLTWQPYIFIRNMFYLFCAIIIIWFAFSLIEIAYKNLNPDAIYSSWNYFTSLPPN